MWTLQRATKSGFRTVAILSALWLSCGCERYCIIWPSIDTRFAPGYSEAAFDRIRPGMSEVEVVALIGEPLGRHRWNRHHPAYTERGDIVWSYTQDGASKVGDWAWLSREVVFREGRVVQPVRWVFRD